MHLLMALPSARVTKYASTFLASTVDVLVRNAFDSMVNTVFLSADDFRLTSAEMELDAVGSQSACTLQIVIEFHANFCMEHCIDAMCDGHVQDA